MRYGAWSEHGTKRNKTFDGACYTTGVAAYSAHVPKLAEPFEDATENARHGAVCNASKTRRKESSELETDGVCRVVEWCDMGLSVCVRASMISIVFRGKGGERDGFVW